MDQLTTTLYRCFDKNGSLLYVGITSRGPHRHHEHQKFSDWWFYSATLTLEHYEYREDAIEAETIAIKTEYPYFNRMHNNQSKARAIRAEPKKALSKLEQCKWEIKALYFEKKHPCPASYALIKVSSAIGTSTKTVQRAADSLGIIRIPVRDDHGSIKSWNWGMPDVWND